MVLGTDLWSSRRAEGTLEHWAIFPDLSPSSGWALVSKCLPDSQLPFFVCDRVPLRHAGCPGAFYIDQAGLERPKRSSCLCLQVVGLKAYTTTPGLASNSFGFITRNGIAGSYTVHVEHFEEPQMVFHPGRTFENHQQWWSQAPAVSTPSSAYPPHFKISSSHSHGCDMVSRCTHLFHFQMSKSFSFLYLPAPYIFLTSLLSNNLSFT